MFFIPKETWTNSRLANLNCKLGWNLKALFDEVFWYFWYCSDYCQCNLQIAGVKIRMELLLFGGMKWVQTLCLEFYLSILVMWLTCLSVDHDPSQRATVWLGKEESVKKRNWVHHALNIDIGESWQNFPLGTRSLWTGEKFRSLGLYLLHTSGITVHFVRLSLIIILNKIVYVVHTNLNLEQFLAYIAHVFYNPGTNSGSLLESIFNYIESICDY